MWETTNMRTKNPRFNHFAPIVCVVCCDVTKTAHHTYRFSTKSPDCERGKPRKISRELRINMFYRTRCINTPAVATNRQADPPSLLSKCFCAAPWLLSSGFPPHIRISDHRYSTCWIFTIRDREPPTFFRADSVTLNTSHHNKIW